MAIRVGIGRRLGRFGRSLDLGVAWVADWRVVGGGGYCGVDPVCSTGLGAVSGGSQSTSVGDGTKRRRGNHEESHDAGGAGLGVSGDFDPSRQLELRKDPGLGVRRLHERGIDGHGISIGIIDQPLLVDHVEYRDRLRSYEEIHSPAGAPAQMHGPAVASIAVGRTVGVAPGADVYYIAEQHGVFH